MGSALQPPFLRQSVAVVANGKPSSGRLRVLARVYFVAAAVFVVVGFLIMLHARTVMSRIGGGLYISLALTFVFNGVMFLEAARKPQGGPAASRALQPPLLR